MTFDPEGWTEDRAIAAEPSLNYGSSIRPRVLLIGSTRSAHLEETVAWYKRPDSRMSAHFLVGLEGEIVQMVPITRAAWFCDRGNGSFLHCSDGSDLRSLDNYSLQIALVNEGPVEFLNGRYAGARVYGPGEILIAAHKHDDFQRTRNWPMYPAAQMDALLKLARALRPHVMTADVAGVEDVARPVGCRIDPGPAFEWEAFR